MATKTVGGKGGTPTYTVKSSGPIVSGAGGQGLAPGYANTGSGYTNTGGGTGVGGTGYTYTGTGNAGQSSIGGRVYSTGGQFQGYATSGQTPQYSTYGQYTQAMVNPSPVTPTPISTLQPPETPTQVSPTTTDTVNPYQGNSVYDYLTQQGQNASFGARRKLAEQNGIAGYRGTAAQNQALLGKLRGATPAQTAQAPVPTRINPQGPIQEQKFGAEAAKLGNEYQIPRNENIATNLKGIAVSAIKQGAINNDGDLQNLVIDYLGAAGQQVDITNPNWENTVDMIASKIKNTPDYQMAINNKFSVDNFSNMDTEGLYNAMDNGILLPGTEVRTTLQGGGKAADLAAAKSKLNMKVSQGISDYIMDFRNTNTSSSLSTQTTNMTDLGLITDDVAGGSVNPLSSLLSQFGININMGSTGSITDDPDVKAMIEEKKNLSTEIGKTKQTIDDLKEDLQAQIIAGGGVATEGYLEALAAEKSKPLIKKYQALVDNYNGVQGALSDTLQFKKFDADMQQQQFSQQMSMLNFGMDYWKTNQSLELQKQQLAQGDWKTLTTTDSLGNKIDVLVNPTTKQVYNPLGGDVSSSNPLDGYSGSSQGGYSGASFTPVDSTTLNTAAATLISNQRGYSQQKARCGEGVNDWLNSMGITGNIFSDPIDSKKANINSYTAKVGSVAVFDWTKSLSNPTKLQKDAGHVGIVTAVDSNGNPTQIADWNSKGDKSYAVHNLDNTWKKAIVGYFDPSMAQDTQNASGSILKATGLSSLQMNYMTQGTTALTRLSEKSRKEVIASADARAMAHGTDTATIQSQYKAYNESLSKNIQRFNNTQIAENEIIGTIDNLSSVADEKQFGKLKVANVAKLFAGEQVNDAATLAYAVHLNQLRNEVALFNSAASGKTETTEADYKEAERIIKNGVSSGSLKGFSTAINNTVEKMKVIASMSVDSARKSIWDLFGVGNQYQPTATSSLVTNKPQDTGGIDWLGTKSNIEGTSSVVSKVWKSLRGG